MAPARTSVNAADIAPIFKGRVPEFKNRDEVVGWIKGKGQCKSEIENKPELRSQSCSINVELPNEEAFGEKGKFWKVSARMSVFEIGKLKQFQVHIYRSRAVSLIPTDSKFMVVSGQESSYAFDNNGKIFDTSVLFLLGNSKGGKQPRASQQHKNKALHLFYIIHFLYGSNPAGVTFS